ncbi:hypothetical protein RHMOL_Rhmol01G0177400 [Rhododendron molle]|uniref:Uncharacterized protein n=3 Tax=Rhododendron molle TaxID=49168 RepID=A0ACC0Q4I4_RHOML|nr:hypothetical protein RHMOL_Rhmol01G0177400 [Rhododendron molle]KAI8572170.1 hypothetical protein RHMOL_Rhmol01G0177400 [Rhododendron molle]KAI8572171.1 hypothetical protein RHMOL_Rhmol01G0177400 [Rhododendron molle]
MSNSSPYFTGIGLGILPNQIYLGVFQVLINWVGFNQLRFLSKRNRSRQRILLKSRGYTDNRAPKHLNNDHTGVSDKTMKTISLTYLILPGKLSNASI